MVGIYNSECFAGRPDSSLLDVDFFNVLCLDPFETYTAGFLKSRIRQLSLHLHPDRLRDWTPPEDVDMVTLNNIKDWLIGTSSTVTMDRWAAVAYRGQVGWQSTWDMNRDPANRCQPLQSYAICFNSSSGPTQISSDESDEDAGEPIIISSDEDEDDTAEYEDNAGWEHS